MARLTATTVNGTLDVTGNTTITGTTVIKGPTNSFSGGTINISGTTKIKGKTTITGSTTITGTTVIKGPTTSFSGGTVNISGATTNIKGTTTITGNTTITASTLNEYAVSATTRGTQQLNLESRNISIGGYTNGQQIVNCNNCDIYGDSINIGVGVTIGNGHNFSANTFSISGLTTNITASSAVTIESNELLRLYCESDTYIGSNSTLSLSGEEINIWATDGNMLFNSRNNITMETSQDSIYLYADHGNVDISSFGMVISLDEDFNISAAAVYINGSCHATDGFFQDSDERLKNIGKEVEVNFDELSKIRKFHYEFKDKEGEGKIGVSAQEVQKVFPELVSVNKEGYLSVNYAELSVVALAAIDKQQKEIEDLKQQIAEIKTMLAK